jgi:hypothetical protein
VFTRAILLCCLALPGVAAWAQQESLTEEFARLSAKERTRIASKEARESQLDDRYQAVMEEAEALFRAQRYDDAMEKFQEARVMRPYNVYPKVKIQDLQALIRQRDGIANEPEGPPGAAPDQPAVLPEQRSTVPGNTTTVAPGPLPAAAAIVPSNGPSPTAPRSSGPPALIADEGPAPLPGEGERIFREGRAVVVERVRAEEGRTIVWRKVYHPWGEVHNFRDGVAITDREWAEAFGAE